MRVEESFHALARGRIIFWNINLYRCEENGCSVVEGVHSGLFFEGPYIYRIDKLRATTRRAFSDVCPCVETVRGLALVTIVLDFHGSHSVSF